MRTGVCVAGSALVLSPVALTGCGSSGTRSLESVTKAATATSRQASEHMTLYATITTGGRVATVKGSGDFRNRPLLGRMTVNAGTFAGSDITMDEIVSGSVAYLSSDGFFGEVPPGIRWLSVEYAHARATSTASATSLTPARCLAQLQGATGAKKIGEEDVDGVQATHYSVTVDPAKSSATAHRTYRSADVWIDGRGLVRQEMLAYSERVDGSRVSASLKIGLGRFGERVPVQAPSPSEAFATTESRLNAILNGGP
jgi:hypothetical protein